MKFTKQDLYTFLLGLGVTLLVVLAQTLIEADVAAWIDDPLPPLVAFLTSMLTSLGRYILTELTQRGLTNGQ